MEAGQPTSRPACRGAHEHKANPNVKAVMRTYQLGRLMAVERADPGAALHVVVRRARAARRAAARPGSQVAACRGAALAFGERASDDRDMTARDNARLVYSTGTGRICPDCGRPAHAGRCTAPLGAAPLPTRIVAKLRVEKAGRGGKSVTVVYDLPRNGAFVKDLCQALKKSCGVGGTVREDAVELQGDVRDRVRELLLKKGFGVRG
jgi:translation initiation factor 1